MLAKGANRNASVSAPRVNALCNQPLSRGQSRPSRAFDKSSYSTRSTVELRAPIRSTAFGAISPYTYAHKRSFHTSPTAFAGAAQEKVGPGGIVQFKLADIGEGIAECEVLEWKVKEGDTIKQFDSLCEVQSDKATVGITSRYDGVITKIYYKKGEMAKVGSPLVDIKLPGTAAQAAPSPTQPQQTQQAQPTQRTTPPAQQQQQEEVAESVNVDGHQVLATPAVRHLARKHNISLAKVPGSGRDGRILKEDILNYIDGKVPAAAPTPSAAPAPAVAPAVTAPPPAPAAPQDKAVPLSGYARIMAKTMTAAAAVPHFGYYDEVIVDKLIRLRSELKPLAEARGIKLTYMPIIVKATSLALKKYPQLNAHYDPVQNVLIHRGAHNIGVAVDTPNGLIVPNIKNCQEKSILDIASELNRIHQASLKVAVPKEDLTGGTFTLSNIGTIGGTYASPVLVVPEIAIGAIGKIQKLPRFDDKGNVLPVHVFNISWSADHRVVDGATMAHFSNLWKEYLENPQKMLLDSR